MNAPTMTRKGQMAMVCDFFNRMDRICESSHEWDRYCVGEIAEERDHRRFKPVHLETPITVKKAAQLFAVQHILQHMGAGSNHDWKGAPDADAADIFAVRLACFQGYALFKKFEKEIRAAFQPAEVCEFLNNVDYAALAGTELK